MNSGVAGGAGRSNGSASRAAAGTGDATKRLLEHYPTLAETHPLIKASAHMLSNKRTYEGLAHAEAAAVLHADGDPLAIYAMLTCAHFGWWRFGGQTPQLSTDIERSCMHKPPRRTWKSSTGCWGAQRMTSLPQAEEERSGATQAGD